MNKIKKAFAALLSLALILSLLPATAMAAEGNTGNTTSGMVVTKNATLENDGTYTIDISAYATGTTTTTVTEKDIPCDIVLVLDQSGSMKKDFSGNTTNVNTRTRQYAMQQAATNFVEAVSEKYTADSDHRMAIVTFSTTASTLVGWTSVNDVGKTILTNAINGLATPSGDTYVNLALNQASELINSNSYNGDNTERQTVVILFTDGMPAPGNTDHFDLNIANPAVSTAKVLKDAGATIYTIGVFSGADTNQLYGSTGFNANSNGTVNSSWYNSTTTNSNGSYYSEKADVPAGNRFLNYLSSNYKNASDMGLKEYSRDEGWGWLSTHYCGWTITENYEASESDYYLTASDSTSLNNIFTTISESITTPTTTVTLSENAVLKDMMAHGLQMTSDSVVTVKTYSGREDSVGNVVKGLETGTSGSLKVSKDTTTVSVSGFDYSQEYITDGHDGEILEVQIKGIVPTDESVTNEVIHTNDAISGIYESAETTSPAVTLPQPETILTSKSYVLDYAKEASLGTLGLSTVKSIVNTMQTVVGNECALTGTYGNVALGNGEAFYTPKTTNWNGYDSFYAFGTTTDSTIKAASANANGNLWSKVNVIPANNVYYEDDFITKEATGTVGIEYQGEWEIVYDKDKIESDGNTETANGKVQGWEASLADDNAYSDGSASAAVASKTNIARATFTFTGTGVDIYSRTNMSTGTIAVAVTGETAAGNRVAKGYSVDNKAASGDYYQIPTFSFSGAYGTYKVTLTVTTAAEGRSTYYLDGIRVYNPIQEEDETVQKAYGESEINAVFTEVRDIMASGAYFIDEDADGKDKEIPYENSGVSELAPEHEVYLATGQSIVIGVDENASNAYYIGLKAPEGSTSVAFSADENAAATEIKHSTDLYYTVTPSDGKIVVKNTGNNLLSITKLRTAGSGESGIMMMSSDDAVNAVMLFNAAPIVTYQSAGATDEELTEVETPEITESEEAESEETITEETGEVVIENPDVSEVEPANKPSVVDKNWIKNLFGSFRNIFGRR